MNYFKTEKRTAFIAVLLIFVIFLPFSVHSAHADDAETVNSWPQAPSVYGASAILMDADSGAILYASNAHERLYPASITKIMTGLLAIENLNLNDTITYTNQILITIPSDAAKLGLVEGETTTIRDALYALLLRSANEVATCIAFQVSGSESEFAKLMTERAAQAGALDTHFTNASGLHQEDHYTTAYDMAMIARTAMANPEFATIWGSENYTLAATNKSESFRIWHRHALLLSTSQYYYPYAIGGKTGYTDEAGRTLVTAAEKDGLRLICVIMKSDDEHIFSDTISLFDYGFNNFTKVNIKDAETRFGSGSGSIPVIDKLYGQDSGIFSVSGDSILLPSNVSLSEIPYTLEFLDEPQNNMVATITYEYEGNYLGKASLIMNLSDSSGTISSGPVKNSDSSNTKTDIRETTSINIYLLLGIGLGSAAALVIIVKVFLHRREMKRRKNRRKNLF